MLRSHPSTTTLPRDQPEYPTLYKIIKDRRLRARRRGDWALIAEMDARLVLQP